MAQRRPASTPDRPRPLGPDEDDVFAARTLEFSGWVLKNRQALLGFGVALFVIIFGVVYFVNQSETRALAAAAELEQVTRTVVTNQLDREAGKAELGRFVERFEGTPFAEEGRLFLAQLHLDDDEAAEALAVLEQSGLGVNDGLGYQIEYLRARALEQAGRLDEAAALYLQLANDAAMTFQEVDALEDAARLNLSLGNASQAAELYGRLIEIAPEGTQPRAIYEMRQAEALAAIS